MTLCSRTFAINYPIIHFSGVEPGLISKEKNEKLHQVYFSKMGGTQD